MSKGSAFTTNRCAMRLPGATAGPLPPGLPAGTRRGERGGRRRGGRGAPASPSSAMRGFLPRRPRAPHARSSRPHAGEAPPLQSRRGGLQAPSTDSAQLRPASRTSPAETPPLLPPAGGLSGRKLVTRFPHRGRRPCTPNPAEGEILSAPLALPSTILLLNPRSVLPRAARGPLPPREQTQGARPPNSHQPLHAPAPAGVNPPARPPGTFPAPRPRSPSKSV